MKRLILIAVLLILAATSVFAASPKEELPPLKVGSITITNFQNMPNNSDFILVDTRYEKGRQNSGYEAVGTVWIDPNSDEALQSFIEKTDRNKPILVYCS